MTSYAAVFPGQGSQSVGMLAALAARFVEVEETFAEASEVLGYDLWRRVQDGPAEHLAITTVTQPAMLASGVAVYRALRAAGAEAPLAVAGHSLGEFSALVAAEVFSFHDAMDIVSIRCQLMHDAVPPGEGGMAAILGLEDEAVRQLCQKLSGARVVEAVNFNAPAQVVISGHRDALERAMQAATEAGARKCVMLPVSVPNHSSLMQPIVAPLAQKIRAVAARDAVMPVVQNYEASNRCARADLIDSLSRHVGNPVYWTATIEHLRDMGAELILELGPGKVLTGLSKRIARRMPAVSVEDPASLDKALALLA